MMIISKSVTHLKRQSRLQVLLHKLVIKINKEFLLNIGHGKFHYLALVATGISLIALVAELIGIGYSAPSAKCDMNFTTSQQGVLNSIAFLGFVCSSHFFGFLSDTWGRHKSLRLALIGTFTFSALSSISISISMLIVTRFFVGFWYIFCN